MQFTDKHKAMLITLLLTGSVIMSLFNLHLAQKGEMVAETFYELEPEELTLEEEKEIFETETEEQQAAETNKAFNETKQYKHFAEAYKPIAPPEDYEFKQETEDVSEVSADNIPKKDPYKGKTLDKDALSKFEDISKVLDKQKANEDSANTNSSVSYSLVDRTHRYLPTPIYLCDSGGKIVVNITVDSRGKVTDAYINSSYKSQNQCLKDHALEYAQEAVFNNKSSKLSQLGSITFYFQGKN